MSGALGKLADLGEVPLGLRMLGSGVGYRHKPELECEKLPCGLRFLLPLPALHTASDSRL